jgi:hypothetical protein
LKERYKEGKKVTGRKGRRHMHLLEYLTEMGRHWKLREEALDHTRWRTRFGRGYGPVVKEITERMKSKRHK